MAPMRLEVVSPERVVYSEEVDLIVAPGIDGELGILPRHAPLLTALKPGEILVRQDGQDSFMAVSSGFLEVIGNKVTVLADTAERADEIDEDRAAEAMQRAQERVAGATADMDLERAMVALRRSQARLRVARRRRRPPGSGVQAQ
jgi:F-type H+-transporting ATPase subunit epsilon